jgi:N-formylglutamate amidohydrolase
LRIVDDFVTEPGFDLLMPTEVRAPVVVDAPHSGYAYPASFLALSRLDRFTIRRSEDAHVDRLMRPCVECGVPMLRARFPRAYLDVNRGPLELDPRMFDGRLPIDADTRSSRVAGGLGTIPRLVTETDEIYAGRIPIAEALGRIERLYRPYHTALRRLLDDLAARFGRVVLIDCHSMPTLPASARGSADIVLGDRNGTSCDPALIDFAASVLRGAGYRVVRNVPYAGGFITEHYGRPRDGIHALQIEIARSLYMSETTLELDVGFVTLRRDLVRLVGEVADHWRSVVGDDAVAAE